MNIDDPKSVVAAAKIVADGMMNFYNGNKTGGIPGLFPPPYYWWEAGAAMGSLIDYWYYTGNTEYIDVVTEAMLFQVGPNNDFMPPNQTKSEGNDDQSFWAFAAMSAAETKFPDPPSSKPQWLALAQAVFNLQTTRWANDTCDGGLRWQIYPFNNGWNYKNTISNGCFFNLASRLAKYTGNQTYADWAEKMYDWVESKGLVSSDYKFYDGTDVLQNCTSINHIQWSYNAGVFLLGAATMYNITGSDKWKTRTQGILDATNVFFTTDPPDVMYEVACEPGGKCNVDQRSFKAYLARWMAATTKMAPFTTDKILPKLKASAQAAAAQCVGASGTTCGIRWNLGPTWDGSTGVGEQMSALEVIQSSLITTVAPPVTAKLGGTSKGDPAAGSSGDNPVASFVVEPVTTGDRVGAGFLTLFILVGVLGGAWWMIL
ncbi:MAG: hydrolase 76 protein [Geoglossum umbratile]|nr:MAG: hydrolase 76 protein [Geoglossum umbratile]